MKYKLKSCKDCLRYDTCPNRGSKCYAWCGPSTWKDRQILREKRNLREKEIKRAKIKKAVLHGICYTLCIAFFILMLGIVGRNDLKTELHVPDGVSISEFLGDENE